MLFRHSDEIFNFLLQKWNNIKDKPNLNEYLLENLIIGNYDLKTVKLFLEANTDPKQVEHALFLISHGRVNPKYSVMIIKWLLEVEPNVYRSMYLWTNNSEEIIDTLLNDINLLGNPEILKTFIETEGLNIQTNNGKKIFKKLIDLKERGFESIRNLLKQAKDISDLASLKTMAEICKGQNEEYSESIRSNIEEVLDELWEQNNYKELISAAWNNNLDKFNDLIQKNGFDIQTNDGENAFKELINLEHDAYKYIYELVNKEITSYSEATTIPDKNLYLNAIKQMRSLCIEGENNDNSYNSFTSVLIDQMAEIFMPAVNIEQPQVFMQAVNIEQPQLQIVEDQDQRDLSGNNYL